MLRDCVHAGRLLRNSPGFAITTVATIALGIAASAVVFSVTNAVLLIGVFAVVSALLAGVGLNVVLAAMVRVRTVEIGVRMAFGAEPASVFRLVVGHGLRLSAVGVAIGLAAALAATRAMTKMLVEVKPTDPMTFAATVLVFLLVAAVESWLPARRAAGLDPTEALRRES